VGVSRGSIVWNAACPHSEDVKRSAGDAVSDPKHSETRRALSPAPAPLGCEGRHEATFSCRVAMPKTYLSICAIYRWEGDYLREWVAFHKLVGAERFYLYDNRSDDNHLEALGPYVADGTVELTSWPMFPGQVQAYTDCIQRHRLDSRWIAFIDIDEFLFSPTGKPLPEVLVGYERWPGVGVNRVTFGTSGHETRQPGLVLENYTRMLPNAPKTAVKSIVDPTRVAHALGPHHFEYLDGRPVDETGEPLDAQHARTDSCNVLRVNHYFTRSEEERMAKLHRPRAGGGKLRPETIRPGQGIREDRRSGVDDDAILGYLPALRAEMERAERSFTQWQELSE
jgi:hypothetical protein